MDTQLSRRISGMIFLSANAFLLITNFQNTNTLQFCASILFLSCSVALILSANNHRWLFWGGFAVAIAYIMTALSNEGSGDKQIELMKPFDILDKYPLAMAGFIEGACCVLLFISSILLSDMRLFLASGLWTIAHGFLIYSDEYLREKLGI
jgi:hypothetical protein